MSSAMVTLFGVTFNIYVAVLVTLGVLFAIAFWNGCKKHKLNWTDMITRDGTKISATKVLQLIGGAIGTWIIVQVTASGKLTWDLFAIYLAYVASIDGFSKLVMAKYGAEGSDDSHVPYRRYGRGGYSGRYRSESDDFGNEELISGSQRTPDPEDL